MAVNRTGGVRIGGGPQIDGQPSRAPGVRSDLSNFNVPFDRDKFTQLIKGAHGYDVLWEKGQYCPFLRGPSPKAHDINCTLCLSGFIYYDACPTQMLVTSMGMNQQYFAYGRFDTGKAQITAYPEFKISFWDRITLCDARARHSELALRQRGTLSDRLKFNPICVDRLIWQTGSQTFDQAAEGDFEVDCTTGNLTWLTSHRPGADTYYSITYFYRPVYIIMDLGHHVRDQKVPDLDNDEHSYEFPIQAVGQLDAFVRKEGLDPSSEGDVENPFSFSKQAR